MVRSVRATHLWRYHIDLSCSFILHIDPSHSFPSKYVDAEYIHPDGYHAIHWAYHQGVPKIIGHHGPSLSRHHRITGVFRGGGEKRLSSLQTPAPPGGCISSVRAQTMVTLNASITTPNALIIPVTSEMIPNMPLMSLVDLGSLDSFVDSGFVEKHHLAANTIPTIRLCLIDGTCNSVIIQAIELHISMLFIR